MTETKADLILHPIRLRIIQTFVPPRRLTAQAIGAVLPDVAPATLYRHLNALTKGGVVAVLERRPVRGTTKKVYAVLAGGAELSPDELALASTEDHLRYFTMFVASLLGDFARYVGRAHRDFVADGVGYRQVPLYLSDEEFTRLVAELNTVLAPLQSNSPAPGRRRRLLSTVVMPVEDVPENVEGTLDP